MSETTSRIAGTLTADLPTVDIDGTPVHLVDGDEEPGGTRRLL